MNRSSFFRAFLAAALALSLLCGAAPSPALALAGPGNQVKATVFLVNDPGDASDLGPIRNGICDTGGGHCTLRAAIEEANGYAAGAPYTIAFSPAPSYLIQPASDLPALTRDGTRIDAGSQQVMIQKPTLGSTATRGLEIDADNCLIHGLTISGFENGIIVDGRSNTIGVVNAAAQANVIVQAKYHGLVLNGRNNVVSGNFIGVLPAAGGANPNGASGIYVNASDIRIGTDGDGNYDSLEGNVISSNADYGIEIVSGSGTVIAGNIIGLNPAGTAEFGNEQGGIRVAAGVNNVRIGTDGSGDSSDQAEGNVISANGTTSSANDDYGIGIEGGSGHKIAGNIIGLDKNGTFMLGNNGLGIWIASAASLVIIGVDDSSADTKAVEANVISANHNAGIHLEGSDSIVAGNLIGLNKAGVADQGNNGSGIFNSGANNTLGTDGDGMKDAQEGNRISGNGRYGIGVFGSSATNTVIAGNTIGLNLYDSAIGNDDIGICLFFGPSGVRIGTNGDGLSDEIERNIISSNALSGISVATSTAVTISGNYIGTNSDGTIARPNGLSGITVTAAAEPVTIGIPNGGVAAQGNLISGNTSAGVSIYNSKDHIIAGNYIGVDAKGGSALPNEHFGIDLQNTHGVRIGTDGGGDSSDELEKNLISGNYGFNISLMGATTGDTVIAGNWIGLDVTGSSFIRHPSGVDTGIGIQNGPVGTIIGTNSDGSGDKLEGNVISGNSVLGISLREQSGTVIAGNTIGLSAPGVKGSIKVPNGNHGIRIQAPVKAAAVDPVGAVRIGTNGDGSGDKLEGNVISGNKENGIQIDGGGGHTIAGNVIGTDWDGASGLGNGSNGIFLSATAGTMTVIGTNGSGLYDQNERNILSGNGLFGVRLSGNSSIVSGNYIGTDLSGTAALANTQGGVLVQGGAYNHIGIYSNASPGEAGEGNLISGNNGAGVSLIGGVQSWVSGNRIGTTASGLAALPNVYGVEIDGGATAQVIGVWDDNVSDALEGNIISGNSSAGIYVSGTLFTQIFGNTIGLGSDQQTSLQNLADGIYLQNTTNTLIGFNSPDVRNLISSNHFNGIHLSGTNTGANIEGNLIGTTASGLPAGNGNNGIRIAGSIKEADGKLPPDPVTKITANTIRYNNEDGVLVDLGAGRGHKLLNNIFGWNSELGIDVGPDDGVTPNDGPNDPDGLQNYPIVQSVSFPAVNAIRITGMLDSQAGSTFTIQLYAASEADPSGYGEGMDPLPVFTVTTNGSGIATFDQTFSYSYGLTRRFFTAIALAPDWSTSEFGPNLELKLSYLPMITR
jgi:parallel beta-helix repeat protein